MNCTVAERGAERDAPEAALDGELVGEDGVHVEADIGLPHADLRGLEAQQPSREAAKQTRYGPEPSSHRGAGGRRMSRYRSRRCGCESPCEQAGVGGLERRRP